MAMTSAAEGRGDAGVGAYGLTLRAAPGGEQWWNPAARLWTPWDFSWRPRHGDALREEMVSPTTALVRLRPAGHALIDRVRASTCLVSDRVPDPHSLVHPYVGSTAVVHAHWQGWQGFHAGGLVVGGRVWAVLGERQSGKSSTLAWAHLHGLTVFADDLLILRSGVALAGPRCLDLRRGAAEHFGMGCDIGLVGARRRWRIRLDQVEAELPFGGWVVLRWSDESVDRPVVAVPAAERLAVLLAARALRVPPPDPLPWLELVAAPMLTFSRPRSWTDLDRAMGCLVQALTSLA